MAVLAGITCRAQVLDRSFDSFGIGMEQHRKKLLHSRYFSLDVPGRAGAYVALDALDLRMRRIAPCHMLRSHHRMAQLAAERGGFRELIAIDRRYRHDQDENHGGRIEKDEQAPLVRIVQIYAGKRGYVLVRVAPPVVSHPPCADRHKSKAENEHSREHEIGHDPVVRVFNSGDRLKRKKSDDEEGSRRRKDHPYDADRIPGVTGCFSDGGHNVSSWSY